MDFEEYQELARKTAIYPSAVKTLYPALGLAGEVGELCELVKKAHRDCGGVFDAERRGNIIKEMGDVLWYLASLAADLDINLQDVAHVNIRKLQDRQARGVLRGSGDSR